MKNSSQRKEGDRINLSESIQCLILSYSARLHSGEYSDLHRVPELHDLSPPPPSFNAPIN